MLHEVATRMRARTDELAELMTKEGGKPLIENSDEIGWTAAAFDYYAELGRNFAGRVIPAIESTQLSLVLKEPMGVVGCIVPWNYPLLLLSWKVAPALAAGNTIVAKPSELTPLSTLELAQCFDHLPPGVINILAGGEVGEAIVADERVDCVAFTGSVETGKKIAHICADRVARINLELGGKDPFIVCPDVAAIEVAAKGRLGGIPERRPGLHLGRALLRPGAGLRRLPPSLRRLHELPGRRRPARRGHRRRAARLRPPAGQGGRPGGRRRRSRRRGRHREDQTGATARATSTHRPSSPAPRPRPTSCGRRPSAGRAARPGQEPGRGNRARERDAVRARRQRLHQGSRHHPPLHARAEGRHRLVQRPRPTTTPAPSAG